MRTVMSSAKRSILALTFFTLAPLPAEEPPAAPSPAEGPTAKVERKTFRAVVEAEGVLVPVEATEMSFEAKAHQGPMKVLDVLPHGASVRKGDVVLRLEDEALREAVKAAEWGLRTARRKAEDARVARREYEADTRRLVGRAEEDLAEAKKSLQGYTAVDRPLRKEEQALGVASYKNNIEDQQEELEQLGKMYREDELTEETEEIVLKRARRNLEMARRRLGLFERRHEFEEEYDEPGRLRLVERAAVDKAEALKDLVQSRQAGAVLGTIEREELDHAEVRARVQLERLKADLRRCVFRANQDGIVIHGSLKDKVAVTILRSGSTVQADQPLITVARPETLEARFPIPEADRYRLAAGMRARISVLALPDEGFAGSLLPVDGLPEPDGSWVGRIAFEPRDPRLLPLLKCKVSIVVADERAALTVPAAAVFRTGDRAVCWVRSGSPPTVETRTVVTGPSDGKTTVIREGLREGEEVLLEEPRGAERRL